LEFVKTGRGLSRTRCPLAEFASVDQHRKPLEIAAGHQRGVASGMLCGMSRQLSSRVLVLLSMAFGIAVAVLGMSDSGAVGGFAAIGGMVLGCLWVVRSFFAKRLES
jgi:membrane associated rhomboid family serine protease